MARPASIDFAGGLGPPRAEEGELLEAAFLELVPGLGNQVGRGPRHVEPAASALYSARVLVGHDGLDDGESLIGLGRHRLPDLVTNLLLAPLGQDRARGQAQLTE